MAKKFFTSKTILLLILILTAILRFYKLGEVPSALSWDEAAQGYNAFALATTGKDEFGRSWPLDYLESFGDFKPVLYTYSAIIPVKLWGLNEFSTRFPSAFFGTLTVLITYFLVKELFKKQGSTLPLLSAFFLGVSPWHVNLSRAAFEANLGLFWVIFAIYLLLRGLNGEKKSLILSSVPFAATFYTFNSTRAFVPVFLLGFALLFFKEAKRYWRELGTAGIVFGLLLIPLIPHLFSPQASLRFREVNIFSDSKPVEISNARMVVDQNAWWSKILHNRRWMFTLEFLRHYTDNLNLRFLFLHGDGNPKFSIQDVGQLYLFDLPFFFLGIFLLIKNHRSQSKFLFLWLLTGIIPAATARETPHALRILQTLPTWQIITAVGWYEGTKLLEKERLKKISIAIASVFLFANIFWYLHHYYAHYPKEFAGEWQYGYKQAIDYIRTVYPKYDKITFADYLGRPYIYFLFYNEYSPEKFRQSAKIDRNVFGFVTVKSFDKYVFGGQDILTPIPGVKTLSTVPPQDLPKDKIPLKTILLPNGRPVLMIYEN